MDIIIIVPQRKTLFCISRRIAVFHGKTISRKPQDFITLAFAATQYIEARRFAKPLKER